MCSSDLRLDKIRKPYTNACDEWRKDCHQKRQQWIIDNPDARSVPGFYTTESMVQWFLEKHNIVVSHNLSGITKLGFASKADVTLFTLKNS